MTTRGHAARHDEHDETGVSDRFVCGLGGAARRRGAARSGISSRSAVGRRQRQDVES